LVVAHELSDLQPVISAEDADLPLKVVVGETFNSFEQPIRVLPKKTGKNVSLIVVNENKNEDPVPFSICGLESLNGTTYEDAISGRKVTIAAGCIKTFITGQVAQVWKPLNH
jgi:hypothetical protein